MRHLDLCSGIGGFALAARWAGIETVGFCEIEDYPRRVLAKNFPGVPIHRDIYDLDGNNYESVELITAGYPCQPFSFAGKRRGAEDDRHIWPEVLRIVTEARPAWTLFENVFGHVSMGLDEVLSDLEAEGYATRTFVVPACAVDAPHRRDRVWIVANAISNGKRPYARARSRAKKECEELQCQNGETLPSNAESVCAVVAHARHTRIHQRGGDCNASQGRRDQGGVYGDDSRGERKKEGALLADAGSNERRGRAEKPLPRQSDLSQQSQRGSENSTPRWAIEPSVGRVAHGIPKRVDRIRGLGNAIVPQVAYQFMRLILDEHFVGNKQ